MRDTALEMLADHRIELAGFPPAAKEVRFAPPRRWSFDRAWRFERVALELEGGVWSGGRHVRGKGYESDCEKYSVAAALGWKVIRCTRRMVEDGTMVELLGMVLRGPDATEITVEEDHDER